MRSRWELLLAWCNLSSERDSEREKVREQHPQPAGPSIAPSPCLPGLVVRHLSITHLLTCHRGSWLLSPHHSSGSSASASRRRPRPRCFRACRRRSRHHRNPHHNRRSRLQPLIDRRGRSVQIIARTRIGRRDHGRAATSHQPTPPTNPPTTIHHPRSTAPGRADDRRAPETARPSTVHGQRIHRRVLVASAAGKTEPPVALTTRLAQP